ncbi:MAG: hypothetical protein WA977_03790 [Halobacteriota archaeon]
MPRNSFRVWSGWGFSHQPRVAHRSPPCKFLSSFFCKCILQAAIDFAECVKCQPRFSPRSPPCDFFFYKCILQGAIDFAERRKRSWKRGAEYRTFFGVAGFAPNPNFEQPFRHQPSVAHRSPPRSFCSDAICLILRRCGSGVAERGRLCT